MERDTELEELTLRLYEAVSSADAGFWEKHLLKGDCIVIGTAPDEWWDDYDSALESIRMQVKTAGSAIQLIAGDIRAYHEGSVGWVADRPVFKLGDVEVICRHTSVFVQRNGEWLIAQHHFSIGIHNEAVFGPEAAKLR